MDNNEAFKEWVRSRGGSATVREGVFIESMTRGWHLAWQAAQQHSAGEIAELKASELGALRRFAFYSEQADALKADNERLREALEIAVEYQRSDVANFHSSYAGYEDEKHEQYDYDLMLVENALSTTPAQSLAKFENEVIERCAKAQSQ